MVVDGLLRGSRLGGESFSPNGFGFLFGFLFVLPASGKEKMG